jgi:ABC-type nitrate/sulfonate/bicarbonate transport system substrate-binding protein
LHDLYKIGVQLLLYLTVIGVFWSSHASAKPVTFAYQTPTLNGVLPLIVGQDFGFFAAEGLEVKTIFIRGGPTAVSYPINVKARLIPALS